MLPAHPTPKQILRLFRGNYRVAWPIDLEIPQNPCPVRQEPDLNVLTLQEELVFRFSKQRALVLSRTLHHQPPIFERDHHLHGWRSLGPVIDRKSTRLNSSHLGISY